MTEVYEKAVSVRFTKVSRAYSFDANGLDLKVGDMVIVETIRGRQIGTIVKVTDEYINVGDPLKPVERLATARDLVARELFNQKKDDVLAYARSRIKELNVEGIKILDTEFSFDGTRILVNYASDNDEKVDLKTLKFDILRSYPGVTNVDLHQLGPRDVAKSISGMGACGLPCRCCSRYLTEFSSISIKMAKEQGISLTPAEITGMCGRLRCCLVYENETYVENRKHLPKKNKRVMTPQGVGKVIEVFPLREAVLVEIPDVGRREYSHDQIELLEGTPQPQPSKEPKEPKENHARENRRNPSEKGNGKPAEPEKMESISEGKEDDSLNPEA